MPSEKSVGVDQFRRLGVYSRNGRQAVHKPLLVLLLLSDIQHGGQGAVRFKDIEPKLSTLIDRFSGPKGSSAKAHYPFWYLRNDGIWSISDEGRLRPRTGKKVGGEPSISLMREVNPLGSMPAELVLELRDHAVLRKAALDVLERGFPPELRDEVAAAVNIQLANWPDSQRLVS